MRSWVGASVNARERVGVGFWVAVTVCAIIFGSKVGVTLEGLKNNVRAYVQSCRCGVAWLWLGH